MADAALEFCLESAGGQDGQVFALSITCSDEQVGVLQNANVRTRASRELAPREENLGRVRVDSRKSSSFAHVPTSTSSSLQRTRRDGLEASKEACDRLVLFDVICGARDGVEHDYIGGGIHQ